MKPVKLQNCFFFPIIKTNLWGNQKVTLFVQISVLSLALLITAHFYNVSARQTTIFIIIELVSIFMLFSISLVTWYTYEFSKGFFQVIGSSCFLIGFLELFHLLSFPGMPQLIDFNSNHSIMSFWIVTRVLEAVIFLFSGILANKARDASFPRILCFGTATIILAAVLIAVLFYPQVFESLLFINHLLISGFIIALLLLATIVFWQGSNQLQDKSYSYIISGIIANIFAEFTFAFHVVPGDTFNLLGHIFKLLSFVIIFHALFGHSVRKPFHDIEVLLNQTITSVSRALDRRDKYTYDHSVRVAKYASIIGAELNMNKKAIEKLELFGLLHDIGKIAIPDEILRKSCSLTSAEWDMIKFHPQKGAEILEPIDRLGSLRAIAEHHERVDGKGYPVGKVGDEISLEARILAVADTFDAMTSDRPYRPKKNKADAIQLLIESSGTQLDPKVVQAFISANEMGFIDSVMKDYL